MKKITLLVASIFLVGSVANASEIINFSDERRLPVDFRDADPIVFTERGIEFFVFPDGQFDFNTRPSTGDIYYKANRRGAVNATHGAPAQVQNGNYGVRVEHDNFGRVRRVGNVFINYDGNDRIKRIGSVYMTYNRIALTQVGGLQIIYNRHGQIIDMVGDVKGRRSNGCSQGYYSNEYENNSTSNDQDYYYYKTDGTKVKVEDDAQKLEIKKDKK
ncbi:hypothetical protein [Flavobacterium sp. GT3R68]|uniref:hypothetical protein n=1 Tax=Flavobacterium sp. GT3R68 TaxID=2594437 RepID=UPI000F86D793|nr:hypothetical protein [Flavobacterium sp. GT3R68]RTY95260.1 hypothetical protein EKL32_07470 [Flavobacterium sp. GSN2]TRW90999.1 hypothetical protein FNW07_09200 [Flavobacterium sp. GT3R68]